MVDIASQETAPTQQSRLTCICGRKRRQTPMDLYTRRTQGYLRLLTFLRAYPALRAFFAQTSLISRSSGHRILDAGCGTGMETLALRDAMAKQELEGREATVFHAFDLTPAMLDIFRQRLDAKNISSDEVSLICCDVLKLNELPASWCDYDVVVTGYMLEYLPRDKVADALRSLRSLLKEDGHILIFIAKRNCITRPLFGWWWDANLYNHTEVEDLVRQANFSHFVFRRLPQKYRHLSIFTHIVEATK